MYLLIYLLLPALGLLCCPHKLSLVAVCGIPIVVASLFLQSPGSRMQGLPYLQSLALAVPWQVRSSWIRDQTHIH